jgi:hypothetical protein
LKQRNGFRQHDGDHLAGILQMGEAQADKEYDFEVMSAR